MTANYTPGPWACESGPSHPHAQILGIDGERIAYLVDHRISNHADARLITTALDGHKLAEHIDAMANDAYLTGHPEWREIVDEARALIAKVEGVGL